MRYQFVCLLVRRYRIDVTSRGADRMKTADALMVVHYVVLSGLLVFTLGYLAGWRQAKRRQ
jgi:hypothetical protein